MGFNKTIYHGYIVKGDLLGAMGYVEGFPEQAELCRRYTDRFEGERYITYEADALLNGILTAYQRYYRDAFYLCMDKEACEDRLRRGLADILGLSGEDVGLSDMEENQVAEAFRSRGFHFLGGKTGGYYGPYIWRTTEERTYQVELPDGVQEYTVKLLDGFISRSWMDYLSFGEIGTGGWTDDDGIINCVNSAYDLDSESFKVSLLKHEAQHARDLAAYKDMSSEELEYRAKLVELIYSRERDLLTPFIQEADGSGKGNGHSSAAGRIVEGFARRLNLSRTELERLPNDQVRAVARTLFEESGSGLKASDPQGR